MCLVVGGRRVSGRWPQMRMILIVAVEDENENCMRVVPFETIRLISKSAVLRTVERTTLGLWRLAGSLPGRTVA